MKTGPRLLAALALACQTLAPARAQQPQPQPSPPLTPQQQQSPPRPLELSNPAQSDEDEVVRITTNLVQLDAVVTDKKGRQVTDLKAEDFEVFEDERPQKITNFSYVSTEPPVAASLSAVRPADAAPAPPAPPRRLRPEQVRRTVALVVDDLGLSFESMAQVRRALRDFVEKQMRPDDLVAVIRTSAGVGALQQFTSDRRVLDAAIERIKWYPSGRAGVGAFAPLESDPLSQGGGSGSASDAEESADTRGEFEDFREEYFAVGTLGALNFVVRGMRELPGRKSVILFSDGFSLYTPERGRGRSDRVLLALRRLVDLANRASVVFYTMDARGLVYTGLTAADDVSGMTPDQISSATSERSQRLFDTQSGLQYLAEETGGFSVRNTNALPVRRVMEEQRGYYLIGYRPETQTFDRRYHRISARLKGHPELRVRTRKGFYGVPDVGLARAPQTREQQLLNALTSPFASGAVRVRLSAIFTATPQAGSYVTSVLHIDARALDFTRQPDGQYQTQLDVVGVTFSDAGTVIDQRGVTQTLRMSEEVYRRVERNGIAYTINVPIKKPGAYQLRVAVRDVASARVGSASQFVEVPDLKKNRLALSGLVVSGTNPSDSAVGAQSASGGEAAQATVAGREGLSETHDPEATPAVRRFRQRTSLDFAYVIFNARADKTTGQPQLTARMRLFRDARPVFEGKEYPVSVAAGQDPRRILNGGRVLLGTNLAPGEYVLQVVVTDALRNDKYRTATQWIDFEVVK